MTLEYSLLDSGLDLLYLWRRVNKIRQNKERWWNCLSLMKKHALMRSTFAAIVPLPSTLNTLIRCWQSTTLSSFMPWLQPSRKQCDCMCIWWRNILTLRQKSPLTPSLPLPTGKEIYSWYSDQPSTLPSLKREWYSYFIYSNLHVIGTNIKIYITTKTD